MDSPFSLSGKNIIITGASSGIGRQCAISCSYLGAKITLIGRNIDRLKDTLISLHGKDHLICPYDITNFEGIEKIIENTVNVNGQIDGLIYSAGIEMTLPLKSMKSNYYQDIFNINVISAFEFIKVISKKKNLSKNASFLLISSVMSIVANPGLSAYCASKGALISGVKSIALELASKNCRVNCVSPGHLFDTEMSIEKEKNLSQEANQKILDAHPLGLGSKTDVANLCVFLLSDASRWITGQNIIIDGGYSIK
ncbi:MAG: SDR family NAD(P)-dependent oxidoreductase [Patescibacteria group bacterium]|nr:SDR family NAD(P)-dependent oxidoreductase [Patescibacteria group bacterium]